MGSSIFGGSSGSSTTYVPTVAAEETVTPAVEHSADTESVATQQDAKSRLRGIRSTYNRFNQSATSTADSGTANKLG